MCTVKNPWPILYSKILFFDKFIPMSRTYHKELIRTWWRFSAEENLTVISFRLGTRLCRLKRLFVNSAGTM